MDKDIWHLQYEVSDRGLGILIENFFFDDEQKAKAKFALLRQDDIDGLQPKYDPDVIKGVAEFKDGTYFISADDEDYYESYEQGNYNSNHTVITLKKVVLEE
jgi:hypothetical protein